MPQEDLDASLAIDVIIKEMTKFSFANIAIEVQEERVVIRSDEPSFAYRVHDLALGIVNLLPDSKVRSLGLNVTSEIECESTDAWHYVGDFLTPKDIWVEMYPETERAGLKNLQIQLKKPSDNTTVYNFSVAWAPVQNCVQFGLNHHFGRANANAVESPEEFLAADVIIAAHWLDTINFYESSVEIFLDRMSRGYSDGRR
ncbi:hypothetical protein [Pseudomonas sp. Irchel 3F5]|uniref:hypothetical protein n=1 Tax=Pseudomonas sp. Irchel 3F5 TaxID=2009002 RepID=UPI0011407BC3|nr:hypothetical protein [Pseudomonas sp. Irchel 3F5]